MDFTYTCSPAALHLPQLVADMAWDITSVDLDELLDELALRGPDALTRSAHRGEAAALCNS